MLSFEGRLTFIKAMLGSLGFYFFPLYKIPIKFGESVESTRALVFWGDGPNKRNFTWVKWLSVLAAKEDGGLGI